MNENLQQHRHLVHNIGDLHQQALSVRQSQDELGVLGVKVKSFCKKHYFVSQWNILQDGLNEDIFFLSQTIHWRIEDWAR